MSILLSLGLCDNLDRWNGERGGREAPEGGDIRKHMADSQCCTAETNTHCKAITLQLKQESQQKEEILKEQEPP